MVFAENVEKREKPIDIHGEIVNKIDQLADQSDFSKKYDNNEELIENISLKEPNVEIRPPISKKINTNSLKFVKTEIEKNQNVLSSKNYTSNISPDIFNNFDFISEIEIVDNKPKNENSLNNKIEIIDFDTLSLGEVKNKTKKTIISLDTPKIDKQRKNTRKKFNINGIFNKKANTTNDKTKSEGLFDLAKNKKSSSKPQLYFLSKSKTQEEGNSNEIKASKSSSSNNIEEELKELKKKEAELEETRKKIIEEEKKAEKIKKQKEKEVLIEAKKRESKQLEEKKRNRERYHQEEKLKKLEFKKAELERKERERIARKLAKKKEYELKKKAREEKLLKRLEEKKAIKLEKEKEKTAKKAALEQQRLQKLHEKERDMDNNIGNIKKPSVINKKEEKPDNKSPIFSFLKGKEKIIDRNRIETQEKSITETQNKEPEQEFIDEDVKKLLTITDNLLGELPEEVIDKFAKSEDFNLYSKVLHKYKIK